MHFSLVTTDNDDLLHKEHDLLLPLAITLFSCFFFFSSPLSVMRKREKKKKKKERAGAEDGWISKTCPTRIILSGRGRRYSFAIRFFYFLFLFFLIIRWHGREGRALLLSYHSYTYVLGGARDLDYRIASWAVWFFPSSYDLPEIHIVCNR